MNFLQPVMLWAVPLIALPIVIHLINQRRYQTMRWGAMRFLLAANRMSRGYAKIRQWLILACRTLAIAGLILAACRPLASGILGLVSGGRADTTIVILDRSPSMSQKGGAGTLSKLEAAKQELVQTLEKLGSTHWVLIESDRLEPRALDRIDALLDLPDARASSASADVPRMLDAAAGYIENNKTGRTEIWICSDLRANDWKRRGAPWQQLRDRFLAFPQSVRFHLFAYSRPAPDNVSVRITEVERHVTSAGTELAISLRVTREQAANQAITVPLQFEIEGARSQTRVELTGTEFELRGHRIPIESTLERGSGRVSIPADVNTADDEFYFAFDKPQPRRTVLVLEDAEQATPLQYAAEVPPSASVICEVERFASHQLDGVAWEDVALVLWQANLPEGESAALLEQFVDRGGQVLFLPPATPNANTFRDIAWGGWTEPSDPVPISTWKMDQDLLVNSLGGISLPVGDLQTFRYCPPVGELTALATLNGGAPLWSRLPTSFGGVYFCSTTPHPRDSTLASNGVVLYVAVQRALAQGAAVLGRARQLTAGQEADRLQLADWKQVTGSSEAISTEYGFRRGVYQSDDGLLAAVNRAANVEDHADILTTEQVSGLFEGLDFSMVETEIGAASSLVQEIWRAFLVAMIIALLVEALLCVPRPADSRDDRNAIFRERHERDTVVKEMQAA